MRHILLAALAIQLTVPLACAPLLAQTRAVPDTPNPPGAPPVVPKQAPVQSTPEVIAPPATMDRGAVVAPPARAGVDPNMAVPGQPGIGLSEGDARKVIAEAGYTLVSELTRGPDGAWSGTARTPKGNVPIVVDRAGHVTAG